MSSTGSRPSLQSVCTCRSPRRSPTSTSLGSSIAAASLISSIPCRISGATYWRPRRSYNASSSAKRSSSPLSTSVSPYSLSDSPQPQGVFAQQYVVLPVAGGVREQRAEAGRLDDAQVDLHPLAQHDGGLRVAMHQHRGDVRLLDQRVEHVPRVPGGAHQVDVADRLLEAAQAARRPQRGDARAAFPQRRDQPLGRRHRTGDWDAVVLGPGRAYLPQDVVSLLPAHPRKLGELPRLGGLLKVGDGGDAELVADQLGRLRPDAGHPHDVQDAVGELGAQALEVRHAARRHQLG